MASGVILQTYDIIKTAEQYRCIDGQLRVLGGIYSSSAKSSLPYASQ